MGCAPARICRVRLAAAAPMAYGPTNIPLGAGLTVDFTVAGTLIIGASHAGVQIAASLREFGDTRPITLVGSEHHLPYQRPPLSKGFLDGTLEAPTLSLRTAEFYRKTEIELIRGECVTDLTLAADGPKGSGIATTASGRELRFDRLALAVGGQARQLRVPGHDLAGVCHLRTLDDATHLRGLLAAATNVAVVGGGFIGLECAAVAQGMGKNVTVVEAGDRLLSRAVAPIMSEFYRRAHVRRGVSILLDAGVTGITGLNGNVKGVRLSDRSELPADLVVIGVGLEPRTEMAEAIGLECDSGIIVDAQARTSEPSIVAAGDCTVLPHPLTRQGRLRIESVQNAVAQGRVAATTLLGRAYESRVVPWFWSDQGDLKLQIAGLSAGHSRYVVRGDPSTERFSVLYYRGERLIAVHSVNSPRDYMAVRKALATDGCIDPALAEDPSRQLSELIDIPQATDALGPATR